jgi:hypothetical protein
MFVPICAALVWIVVLTASIYSKVDAAHAFVFANLSVCCWFLAASAFNISKILRRR